MRRKSTRNTQKPPEKAVKEETATPKTTRRSKRRKRSPSKSSDSEDEIIVPNKRAPPEPEPEEKETPDTTTKSHSPTDEETPEEPVWKVTPTEETPRGEIQKLKICLTRPSPDSPGKKTRRSKSGSHTEDDATSSEDKSSGARKTRSSRGSPFVKTDGLSSQEEDVEEKKGKGKSKGKHKSKIEKPAHLNDPEIQTNNEISENAQVTPQSPSIDKPVDNENDYTKVDPDETNNSIETRGDSAEDANNCELDKQSSKKIDSDSDDEPLSVINKLNNESLPQEKDIVQTQPLKSVTEELVPEPAEKQSEQPHEVEEQVANEVTEKEDVQIEIAKVSETIPATECQEISQVHSENVDVEMKEVSLNNKFEESVKTVMQVQEEEEEEEEVQEPVKEATPIIEKIEEQQSSSNDTAKGLETSVPKAPRKRLNRDLDLPKSDTNEIQTETSEPPQEVQQPTLRIKPSRIKRKWNSSAITSDSIKIDLEAIQSACPTLEFPENPDLHVKVPKERRKSGVEVKKVERKVSIEYASDSSEKPTIERQVSVSSSTEDSEDRSNIIAFNRKISIVDDTASKLRPPPSPAKNPTSDVLFLTNLVRPFTLKQLRELLERTGSLVEDGFWTDRIKSKCYVQYKSVEEAEATRNALHGVQWPIGNGKNLIIDYSTRDDLEKARNPPAPPPPPPEPETKVAVNENVEPAEPKPAKIDEKTSREAERKKRSEGPVREWDIGKKDLNRHRSRSRSRDRERDRERGRKHRRSPSPIDDFITRKQRKAEESAPQKLMDDLFLKTKATPSIFWQPLSPDEISMKQQQRLLRMEEHKRRMEENTRVKMRDVGRGGFRRRYD